ncbi:MAG: hypothetical protein AAFX93_19655 [Verrucomicrobiota bacterium]
MKGKKELHLQKRGKKGVFYVEERIYEEKAGRRVERKIRRSTGSTHEPTARDIGYQIYLDEMGMATDGTPKRKRLDGVPTIGEVVDRYVAEVGQHSNIKPKTALDNAQALLRAVKVMYPKLEPTEVKADVLSKEFVLDWRRRKRGEQPEAGKRLNASLNSALASAQHVFSKVARRELYHGFNLPFIDDFLAVPRLEEHDQRFRPIPPDLMAQLDESLATNQADDVRLLVVIELARYCGLRASEIEGLRWHWFDDRGDAGLHLGIFYRAADVERELEEYEPKATEGWVAVDRGLFARWQQLCPPESPTAYVIPGKTKTERHNLIARDACQWVAQFLPERRKKLHELRKQFGAEIATDHGIYAAATALRDSVAVAEKHYASLVKAIPARAPVAVRRSANSA